jgi:hypothetical protein
MKKKTMYGISVIVIALPWLFLLEVLPIPYYKIGTALEVTMEGIMAALLLAIVLILRNRLKLMKEFHAKNLSRIGVRILFVLACLTLFIVVLILVLIGISFTL